jgi:hypothetical protein
MVRSFKLTKIPFGRLRFAQQDGQCRDRRIPSQALERSEARASSHVVFGVHLQPTDDRTRP